MDLRIPYRDEYMFEPNMPATRTENYVNPKGWEYLTYQWLGWVMGPDGTFVPSGVPEEAASVLGTRIKDSWEATMASHGGKLATLQEYLFSLNLPDISQGQKCDYHRSDYESLQGGQCRPAECRPGQFLGETSCVPCSVNTFKAGTNNNTACDLCSTFSTTLGLIGSPGASSCICDFNYFGEITSSASMCAQCDARLIATNGCPGGNLMIVPEGLFKPADSITLYNCVGEDQCSVTYANISTPTQCIEGSAGPLCGTCEDNWMIDGVGSCTECM